MLQTSSSYQKLEAILNNLNHKVIFRTKTEETDLDRYMKSLKKVNLTSKRSRVFREAWILVKKDGISLSEALKLTWATYGGK